MTSCRWSYGFEDKDNVKNGRAIIADIILCLRDKAGESVIVVEAKRGGGALKEVIMIRIPRARAVDDLSLT